MVVPFPYKSALEPLIFPEQFLIFLKIAGTISHGMSILAQNMRLSVAVIALPDALQPFKSRVHGRIDIRDIRRVITLIMDQPGSIQLPDLFCRGVKILSHRGLISKRPHQDTRMVPVLLNHAHRTVYVCLSPTLLIVQPLVFLDPFKPVGFQIRLIDDIEAIFITKPVKIRHLRIMGTPDGIDVITLHHAQMLFHRLAAYRGASRRTKIMHIDTVDQDRHTIYQEIRTSYLHSPESRDDLRLIQYLRSSLSVVQLKRHLIKRRYLRTPGPDTPDVRPDPGASLL